MAVYKNNKKLWSIRGTYKNQNGEYKRYNLYGGNKGFKTKKEAEKVDSEYREKMEVSQEDKKPRKLLTLEQGINYYVQVMSTQLKQSTLDTNVSDLKIFEEFNDIIASKITSNMIDKKLKQLNNLGYSINYIDKCYFTINKIYKFFLEEGIASYNPVKNIKRIKRPNDIKEKDSKNNYLTLEEFELLIKNTDDQLYYTMFNFLYFTGCRKGEVLALKWNDIDFNNNTFNIYKTCYFKKGGGYDLTPPKNRNAIRLRKMPNRLVKIMKEWYKEQSNLYGFNIDYFVFGATYPITRTTLATHLNNSIKKANIKKITVHGFRHSHVSYLANQGIRIGDVAYRIGDTVQVAQETYMHLFPERESEIMDLIG